MLLNSKPVRYLITRLARSYGFMDPMALLARMRGFAKPSEVAEPIELLRAGMLFHARGLVNTKAIQNNLDWVWPYWVERQFNPSDASFIPRAFSFSHINLTHRNWTAVGLPDVPFYPIVDPRGLVTPIFDGWSLDFWYVPAAGEVLFPSKLQGFEQRLWRDDNLRVRSLARDKGVTITSEVSMCLENGEPHCCIDLRVEGATEGFIAVALRPYNPEGVSFVEEIEILPDKKGWSINDRHQVTFDRLPAKDLLSTYHEGDVSLRLAEPLTDTKVKCDVSMATAVALFPVSEVLARPLHVRAPIYDELEPKKRPTFSGTLGWDEAMEPLAQLRVPEARIQELFDLAVTNVVLHAPKEVYPGPYTYKRFWFRDAVFVLNALLSLGGVERTRRAMGEFVPRQRRDGYFLSQEGEWDSNGEALWFFHRFITLTGEAPKDEWLKSVAKGARWISRKRIPVDSGRPAAGLLPAGFSAEYLGPNDFYYWDDFWAVAGLRCASQLLRSTDPTTARECEREAEEFIATIERSYPKGPHRRFPNAIPASPLRRMDSGAVGSLVADYPLQLFAPANSWVMGTADYLRDHSLHDGGFFQDMIHSGINAYLTIHLAQVRLRAGQVEEAWALMDRVVELASPTGQWPEAIHPNTGGGCMGDGEHIWAAAEWLMLIRNLFVREETDCLVIGSGIRPAWSRAGVTSLGPTLTPHGSVTVIFEPAEGGLRTQVKSKWRGPPPRRELRVPGCAPLDVPAGDRREEFFLKFQP